MHGTAPGSVLFDGDEAWRITRTQAALKLHIPPHVIDAMPLRDVHDVLEISTANEEIQNTRTKRQTRKPM